MAPLKLRFLFLGCKGEWKPLEGHHAPPWEPYQVRSLPGNVVACAPSPEEAVRRLRRKLEACFARAGSAVEWYRSAEASMTEENQRELEAALRQWWTSGPELTVQDNYEYARLEQPSSLSGAC